MDSTLAIHGCPSRSWLVRLDIFLLPSILTSKPIDVENRNIEKYRQNLRDGSVESAVAIYFSPGKMDWRAYGLRSHLP
jgi:hypothetical protein